MNLVLAMVLLAAVTGSVHGATLEERLSLCRAKGLTLERLACYDELAGSVAAGVSLPSLPSAGIGKWEVRQEVDPMDDTRDLFANLISEDWVSDRRGAVLHMICYGETGFEVQLVLHGVRVAYPTGRDESEKLSSVQWRFDKQEAVSGEWWVSDSRRVLYPFGISGGKQWARDVLRHSKLFVRIRPSEGWRGEGDFLFDLRGAAKAVQPVLDACGG